MRSSRGNTSAWILAIIAAMIVAFYFGWTLSASHAPQAVVMTATTTVPVVVQEGAEYYGNPAEWQTYSNSSAGFSIAYPIDFPTDEPVKTTPSTSWRANNPDQTLGTTLFTLTVPSAFDPQTNFAGATLTLGMSKSAKAVADCLVAQNGEASTSPQTLGNTTFSVFTGSSAGAGNLYDTTSYRAVKGGACYALEYTIHSSQIANYPASYNLHPFDQTQVSNVLNTILGTFSFL